MKDEKLRFFLASKRFLLIMPPKSLTGPPQDRRLDRGTRQSSVYAEFLNLSSLTLNLLSHARSISIRKKVLRYR